MSRIARRTGLLRKSTGVLLQWVIWHGSHGWCCRNPSALNEPANWCHMPYSTRTQVRSTYTINHFGCFSRAGCRRNHFYELHDCCDKLLDSCPQKTMYHVNRRSLQSMISGLPSFYWPFEPDCEILVLM